MLTADRDTFIANLRRQAEAVAANERSAATGATALKDAQASLLREIADAVAPARRAIGDRVAIAGTITRAGATTEAARFRGVRVGGAFAPDRDGAGESQRGRYAGRTLLLRDDGRWVQLTYDGSWSDVEGEVSRWVAAVALLTDEEVVEGYKVEAVVGELAAALARAVTGSGERRGRLLRDRAERLRSLAALMRSGS